MLVAHDEDGEAGGAVEVAGAEAGVVEFAAEAGAAGIANSSSLRCPPQKLRPVAPLIPAPDRPHRRKGAHQSTVVVLREGFRGDEDDAVMRRIRLRQFRKMRRDGGEVEGEKGPAGFLRFAKDAIVG